MTEQEEKKIQRRDFLKLSIIASVIGGLLGSIFANTQGSSFIRTFSIAITMKDAVVINIITWRARFACTVTNVRGYRVGGIGATINARKNGISNHLATALSLTSADTWLDGGTVQNTAYAEGDKLEMMIISVTGSPTQIAIQVDFERT